MPQQDISLFGLLFPRTRQQVASIEKNAAAAAASADTPTGTVVPFPVRTTTTTTAAPAGGSPLTLAQTLAALRTPDEILQTLMAAEQTGEVGRWFARQDMPVPAGTTQTMLMPLPGADALGFIIGEHRMQVTPDLTKATITHIDDNDPVPLVYQAPGGGDIRLLGSFFRPVRSGVTHIVQGDPDLDVLFTMELQGVLIAQGFWAQTLKPMLEEFYEAIRQGFGG